MAVRRKQRYPTSDRSTSRPGDTMRPRPRPTVFKPQRAPSVPQQAPLAPPSAATSIPQTATALSGGGGGYDVNSDPAVAAAQGLAAKIRANAQASALAKRVQAALEYGDPTGVEGINADQAKAAKENPFSVLKNLEHNYATGKQDLEEGLNKSNLFYSGYRGQQLGEAARGYEQSRYGAGTAFKGLMTDIGDNLQNALLQADMYEQNALLGSTGGSYGGGDGGGGGGGTGNYATDLKSALGFPTNPSFSGAGYTQGVSPMSNALRRTNERRRASAGLGT